MAEILTPGGAKVHTYPAPEHYLENDPDALMLHLSMLDSEDQRHAQVVLSGENRKALSEALDAPGSGPFKSGDTVYSYVANSPDREVAMLEVLSIIFNGMEADQAERAIRFLSSRYEVS